MAELKIRNIDDSIKSKLRYQARQKGISLNQYLKNILTTFAVSKDLQRLDFQYQALVESTAFKVEDNTKVLTELCELISRLIEEH